MKYAMNRHTTHSTSVGRADRHAGGAATGATVAANATAHSLA